MELLRDKPEFKEKIEDNIFLAQEVEEIIDDVEVETDYSEAKEDIISEILEKIGQNVKDLEIGGRKIGEVIESKEVLALDIFNLLSDFECDVTVTNKREISADVIEKMSEFVRENYGISIKETYLQTVGIL